MVDITRLSSTLAERKRQQLFQEMESDESIFRNAVMAMSKVIEDVKIEETAISRRRVDNTKQAMDGIRSLTEDEVSLLEFRQQQREKQLRNRANGRNIINDPRQWAFPNVKKEQISRDYLWMLDIAKR